MQHLTQNNYFQIKKDNQQLLRMGNSFEGKGRFIFANQQRSGQHHQINQIGQIHNKQRSQYNYRWQSMHPFDGSVAENESFAIKQINVEVRYNKDKLQPRKKLFYQFQNLKGNIKSQEALTQLKILKKQKQNQIIKQNILDNVNEKAFQLIEGCHQQEKNADYKKIFQQIINLLEKLIKSKYNNFFMQVESIFNEHLGDLQKKIEEKKTHTIKEFRSATYKFVQFIEVIQKEFQQYKNSYQNLIIQKQRKRHQQYYSYLSQINDIRQDLHLQKQILKSYRKTNEKQYNNLLQKFRNKQIELKQTQRKLKKIINVQDQFFIYNQIQYNQRKDS